MSKKRPSHTFLRVGGATYKIQLSTANTTKDRTSNANIGKFGSECIMYWHRQVLVTLNTQPCKILTCTHFPCQWEEKNATVSCYNAILTKNPCLIDDFFLLWFVTQTRYLPFSTDSFLGGLEVGAALETLSGIRTSELDSSFTIFSADSHEASSWKWISAP